MSRNFVFSKGDHTRSASSFSSLQTSNLVNQSLNLPPKNLKSIIDSERKEMSRGIYLERMSDKVQTIMN